MAAAEELITNMNIYNLSEVDNSPQAQFFDVSGESLKLSHPTTEGFWEFLHEVYSKETLVRDEDKNLVGLMHTIGIVPGEPFEPDDRSKEILHGNLTLNRYRIHPACLLATCRLWPTYRRATLRNYLQNVSA